MESNIPIVATFASYLRHELNRSPHTIDAYVRDIRNFASWISGSPQGYGFDPATVTVSDIRAWLGHLAKKESPLTLRRKAQSLRALFHWMLKTGKIENNPASDIILAKAPKKLPQFLKEEEIEKVISENLIPDSDNEYSKARAHIVLLILYSTGLRQEELRMLSDSDINFSLREVKVTGKRSKQRVVPLPAELLEEIRTWQGIRNAHFSNLSSLDKDIPLITGRNGRISKSALYNIVHNALSETTPEKKSPHLLRHTFATTMLNNGASLDSVKEFLGHASLSTTQIYTHLSFSELRESYSKAHPRSKKKSE